MKSKKKKKTDMDKPVVASIPWTGEMPTPERLGKAGENVSTHKTGEGRTAVRFTDGDIIEHMESRGMINGDQYDCGKRFCRDWYRAGLAASGVVDPGRIIVDGGNPNPSITRSMEYAQLWAIACKSIGKVHSHPLISMALLDEPADIYALRHMGHRDPKDARLASYTLLKSALDALVLHYLGPRHMRHSYHRQDDAVPSDRPDVREAS